MLYVILGLIAVFFAVILIRAAAFKPAPQAPINDERIDFDKDAAIHALGELIKCRTVSYNDPALEDNAEFEKNYNLYKAKYKLPTN